MNKNRKHVRNMYKKGTQIKSKIKSIRDKKNICDKFNLKDKTEINPNIEIK